MFAVSKAACGQDYSGWYRNEKEGLDRMVAEAFVALGHVPLARGCLMQVSYFLLLSLVVVPFLLSFEARLRHRRGGRLDTSSEVAAIAKRRAGQLRIPN